VRHEVGNFLTRDGGVRLGCDVAVQEQPQAKQDDGFHPAECTLLPQDAGAGAASDCLGVHRTQDGDLPFVVQFHGEEQLGQPAAQDHLVVQQDGPELLVPAAVDIRTLEELHQRLPHLHGQHPRIPGEEGGAVDERVAGGYGERPLRAGSLRAGGVCHVSHHQSFVSFTSGR
jgi:hypothetical protein